MAAPTKSPRSSFIHNYHSFPSSSWLIFLLGCLLGHFHGRISAIHRQMAVRSMLGQQPLHHDDRHSSSNPIQPPFNNDGWRILHVFQGSEPMVPPSDQNSPTTSDNNNNRIVSQSQARQDEVVYNLLRQQKGGYFVDLAANDAIALSNTYVLEQQYDWKGICIEPNEMYWKNLSLYRSCDLYGAVLGKNKYQTVHFRFEAGDHGGIADNGFDNGKRWQSSSELRQTTTLLEILQRSRAPSTIDYLSLDVEGAESFILLDFPFDKYTFKILTAERLRGEIRTVLKDHGYEFVAKLTRWGESLWVHNSTQHALDWSIMDRYNFPL